MKIADIIAHLESVAPLSCQESYDNAGLIIGNKDSVATGAVISLDATEEVLDEAMQKGCNLVVAHHPIVFRGLKKINGNSYIERTVIKAIKNDIAIYAIHTNLDNMYAQGVNAKIAEKLGLSNTRILAPKNENLSDGAEGLPTITHQNATVGAGMIGELPKAASEMDFLQSLKALMNTNCIRHTKPLGNPINTVAVCGGSGSFLLPEAIRQKADIFITGDFKYHEFFDADGRILIADIGHYESEQFTIELLHEIIAEKFPTFALHLTKVITNPVRYF